MCATGGFPTKDRREYVSDAFAACFLMPAVAVFRELRRITAGRKSRDLTELDVAQLQLACGTSWAATVIRLRELGCIGKSRYDQLRNARVQDVFKSGGLPTYLLQVTREFRAPRGYVEMAEKLLKAEEIDEAKFRSYMRDAGLEPNACGLGKGGAGDGVTDG